MFNSPRSEARTVVDAHTLAELYAAPSILRVINVWDAVSSRVISDLAETKAIATAGHSIAASHGYPDGEKIPVDLMVQATAEIVQACNHPVTADIDGGFGNAGETVRKVVGVGVCGANLEDQLRPLAESVKVMEDAIRAGEQEGVPFVLNARTDAFVRGGHRDLETNINDAIERGRAYLDAGATCVFVPGVLDAEVTKRLVEGIGERKVSVIGLPGALTAEEYEALGVARISYGPMTQNVALTALKNLAFDLYGSGVIPEATEKLNNL